MSFLTDAERVITALHEYYQESISGEKPVIDQIPIAKLIADLDLSSHIRDGRLSGERLSQFITTYLSTTALRGKRYLRFVIMSPHTTLDDIKRLIDEIRHLSLKNL
jgi:hypothetical protein